MNAAAIAMNPFVQLAGIMLLAVLGMSFGEDIIDSAVSVLNNAYIDSFTGLSTVAGIFPTLYYLGLLGIVGSVGTINVRKIVA